MLDSATLLEEGEDEGLAVFKHCHDSITHLMFSHDSKYLASAVSTYVLEMQIINTKTVLLYNIM